VDMCVGEMRAAEGGLQVCPVREPSCPLREPCKCPLREPCRCPPHPPTHTLHHSIYWHARTETQDLRARAPDSGIGLNHVISDHEVLLDPLPATRT
jgi:hypothetical protein